MYAQAMSAQTPTVHLTACHSCDALLRLPAVQHSTFHCPRCDAVVYRAGLAKRVDDALALGLAAAVFFLLANSFPIVAIESGGDRSFATLPGASLALYKQGMSFVAFVVAITTLFIPAIELSCTLGMLWFAKFKRSFSLTFLFRLRKRLRPWSMIEIFMLGTLVAIVKLGSWAHVLLGVGLWSLGIFMVLHAATSHAFEAIEFWSKVQTES